MRFAVWAPRPALVELQLNGATHQMASEERGWWTCEAEAEVGDRYAFVLDGAVTKDPRSRWQPDGSLGLSAVADLDFAWSDDAWVRRAPGVIYELHIGTFTPGGTFDAAIDRLPHLVALGVDTVEVLPVNGFDGDRGWGYDGVDLWAVHRAYGGPVAFQRFVDAAHAQGLAVVLDVVYNHLGPSGNLLPRFGPYLTESYGTTWGPAINLDQEGSDEVRAFLIGNALQWLEDFHCDGLRLDAVHALHDRSSVPFLEQLATAMPGDRWLVAESDRNDPHIVTPRAQNGLGLDAMWADDLHHCLHSLLTGERVGYYVDYGTVEDLVTAWSQGYLYDERFSVFRDRTVGRPVPPGFDLRRVVVMAQDHDQIGNRARGDRPEPHVLAMMQAVVLLSAMTPMLFMGEEWAAQTPWCFFSGFGDTELAEAVRTGRRAEFASFGWKPEDVPDPMAVETFESSRLDWSSIDEAHLEWVRWLIETRRTLTDAPPTARVHGDRVVLAHGGATLTLDLSAMTLVVEPPSGPPRSPPRDT
jgi:maltooligosyltrehalose trehalohydrolase